MITWLEKLLTRTPVYILVNGALSTLIGVAFIFACFGQLPFGPLALIVSTLVFVVVGVTTSYGLGRLYSVHSHLPSVFITALIMSLIFTPTLEASALVHYALVALIAQVSKYVIVYERRHIFNPAAFGAFVAGLLQLQFASWWVGSPPLSIFVAVAAFLVLYKTRQLPLGVLFMALALGMIIISGVWQGEDLLSMGSSALLSWPLLFIAGFMLSEPLTLPPRKWQKFVVGIVVAVVTSLPFHVAWFHSSPEFALLAGNLLAFVLAFRQRKGLQFKLTARRNLTPTAKEYVLQSKTPINFEPGQYIELTLPHKNPDIRGFRRAFSITSRPDSKKLSLGIKFYNPGSTFKTVLQELPIGSTLQATGITGDFILPGSKSQKLLFIASGIGITPFISHILSSQDRKQNITLLYFVRSREEIAYKNILDKNGINVHYFIADSLTNNILDKHVTDLHNHEAYISGPPSMVARTKQLLKGRVSRTHTDYFSGY